MKLTRLQIIERITDNLNEALESINAEDFQLKDNVTDLDTANQEITIKFKYHVVEEDDYVGLSFY